MMYQRTLGYPILAQKQVGIHLPEIVGVVDFQRGLAKSLFLSLSCLSPSFSVSLPPLSFFLSQKA